MALDQSDLAALGQFITTEVAKAVDGIRGDMSARQAADTAANREAIVGKPEVDPEAGPEFYVHLANGNIVKTYDSTSTHMAAEDGDMVAVIGRYQVGG